MIVVRPARPRVIELWFNEPLPSTGADAVIFRQYGHPPAGVRADPFHTLVIDLRRPEEEIFAFMRSGTRNEIRRDPCKDGLTTEAIEHPADEVVAEFVEFYRQFAARRRVLRVKPRWLQALARAKSLQLTRARANGETVVWHSYMTSPDRVRLLHSVSLHRDADQSFRNLTGRANRLLHWRDIVGFRTQGVRTYDFGGWYDGRQNTSLVAINRFKEGFGGVRLTEYSGMIGLTRLGRIYIGLRRLRDRLRG